MSQNLLQDAGSDDDAAFFGSDQEDFPGDAEGLEGLAIGNPWQYINIAPFRSVSISDHKIL